MYYYFKKSLKNFDEQNFKKVFTTDNHHHFFLSASRKVLDENCIKMPMQKIEFENIDQIDQFAKEHLKIHYQNKNALMQIIKSVYQTASQLCVNKIKSSINFENLKYFNNSVQEFKQITKQFEKQFKTKIEFDIGIVKVAYNASYDLIIKNLIDTKFFKGIDLYGKEEETDYSLFKNIFDHAKKHNLSRKIHVGEYLSAKEIQKAILQLNPTHIQHGIRIVEDEQVMDLARKRKIVFNLSPSSNIFFKLVKDYKSHPIKQMVENKLIVTLGTDDITIIDNNLFLEYYNLYKNNIFSIKQLNKIRKNGIKYF